MKAGIQQFVILAAGLDARAWRIPNMHKSIKVFEVDVPRAIMYKKTKLHLLEGIYTLDCSRIEVCKCECRCCPLPTKLCY